MIKTNNLSIRINEDVKSNFDLLCKSAGITASAAVNVFILSCTREKKLPAFIGEDIIVDSQVDLGIVGSNTRMAIRLSNDVKDDFCAICCQIGISMGMVVKMFILKCLATNSLNFQF